MKRASLNHSFRLVWSTRCGGLMTVAETTRSRGKGAAIGLSTALLMSGLPLVSQAALPTGGSVEAGSGSISQNGNAMTINQGSDRLAINWNSFSIGAGNSVTFNQPNSSSVALNRVLGSEVSVIQGALNANGQVFLVNPNGVLFSPTAQVNVGSIVASTLNISAADFMAGNYRFEGHSSNAIINQGNIQAANGGSIALIAAQIINTGNLTANGGNVLLGAGSRVTLDLGGPVKLDVEEAAIDALIEQGGTIRADGGRIYLTAKAAGDLARTVINHTGITEARTLSTGDKGEIVLLGDMDNDRIQVAGTLDASAPHGGDGGFIETSAANVNISNDLQVTTAASTGETGQWLIDPVDITIASSGGNVTGSAIAMALQNTNVTLDTFGVGACSGVSCALGGGNGDIIIDDDINVSAGASDTTLTLKAERDIVMRPGRSITRTGTYGLSMVLWANSDGSGAGSIYLMEGAAISSNGGHLWLGGGSGSATWNGLTVGDGYAIAGTAHRVGALDLKNGISLYRSSLNSAGGDIALYGKSANQSGAYGYMGIYQEQSSISSGAGDIDVSAISTGSSNDGFWHYGLLMATQDDVTASSISSTSGVLRINAETDFGEDTFGSGLGLYSFNSTLSTVSISSHSGEIYIIGKLNSTGHDGQFGGIYAFGAGQEMIVSRTGNISLQGTSANANVAGINVHPGNTTSRIGYDGVNAYTGNITLNANTFISYEGAINANQLELLGSGVTYTLTNANNNVSRLIGNTGTIIYVDADALELGAITASGALNIATLNGNITLNGNLHSASTAADAIVLNAGKNAAAGSSTGGNIIHSSGILSSGANGRITLLTGSVAGSSGLAALVSSGSGRFRYNTDETSNGYDTLNAALGSGLYALYREQPLLLVTPGSASSALGAPISLAGISSTISGYANGDHATLAGLSGTASYSTDATNSSNAGSYQISYTGGLSNILGYGIADNSASTGEYSIIGNTSPTSEPPVIQPPLLAAVSSAQASRAMTNADGLSAGAQTSLEFVATDSADTPDKTTQGGAQPSGFMQVFVVNGGINVPSDSEANADDENGEDI